MTLISSRKFYDFSLMSVYLILNDLLGQELNVYINTMIGIYLPINK